MEMEPYLIHIIDGKPKVGPEKPDYWAYYLKAEVAGDKGESIIDNYFQIQKDWEAPLMDVERITGYGKINESFGIEYIEGSDTFDIKSYDPGKGDYKYREVKIGQQVEITKTGDKKCKIIKLI